MDFDSSIRSRRNGPYHSSADMQTYSVEMAEEERGKNSASHGMKLIKLPQKRKKRAILSLWAIGVDVSCIIFAFAAASYLRLDEFDADQVSRILMCMLPIYLGVSLSNRAHEVAALTDSFRSIWRASTAFAFAVMSLLLIAFFMKIGADFSRLLFGLGAALSTGLLVAWRSVLVPIGHRYLGENPFANLYICDGVTWRDRIGSSAIDADDYRLRPDPNDPAVVDRLGEIARGMDSIIVHCAPERRTQWAFMLKSLDVTSEIVVPELSELLPLGVRRRSGETSLVIRSEPLTWSQRILKRLLDLFVALAVMPFLLPLFAIIAVAIKLDSAGPVFFKQPRIGLGNRSFQILKFRSMRVDRCDTNGDRSTARGDDRITVVGNFLRKTSLDELPQFLNILYGDMSVVGPRPHAVGSRAENELFWDIDNRYWHRHSVKPGLTGLAQVRGFRGATEVKSDLSNRLQADLEYVRDWSLRTDIRIIFQTFAVIFHKNAF